MSLVITFRINIKWAFQISAVSWIYCRKPRLKGFQLWFQQANKLIIQKYAWWSRWSMFQQKRKFNWKSQESELRCWVLSLYHGGCVVSEDSSGGHWQGRFANRASCVLHSEVKHTLPLCVWCLGKYFHFWHVEVICIFLSFVHMWQFCLFVATSGNSKREQVWVGNVVSGDPGELQLWRLRLYLCCFHFLQGKDKFQHQNAFWNRNVPVIQCGLASGMGSHEL